jgi:hypothetical protein
MQWAAGCNRLANTRIVGVCSQLLRLSVCNPMSDQITHTTPSHLAPQRQDARRGRNIPPIYCSILTPAFLKLVRPQVPTKTHTLACTAQPSCKDHTLPQSSSPPTLSICTAVTMRVLPQTCPAKNPLKTRCSTYMTTSRASNSSLGAAQGDCSLCSSTSTRYAVSFLCASPRRGSQRRTGLQHRPFTPPALAAGCHAHQSRFNAQWQQHPSITTKTKTTLSAKLLSQHAITQGRPRRLHLNNQPLAA